MYVEALQQFVRPSSSTSVALAPVFTREVPSNKMKTQTESILAGHGWAYPRVLPDPGPRSNEPAAARDECAGTNSSDTMDWFILAVFQVLKHGAQQRGATHAALRSSSPVNPECTSLPLIMQQRNREVHPSPMPYIPGQSCCWTQEAHMAMP